jgi:hypothetical protein
MNQGTQGYCWPKKTEGRKSRDTVPLIQPLARISATGKLFARKFTIPITFKALRPEGLLATVYNIQT